MTETYRGIDRATLDRGYNARSSVASFDAEYAKYVEASARARAEFPDYKTLVYDETSRQALDLFSAGENTPVFVWLHGGYWRALSKDDNSFVALGLVSRGISVAVVDYSLVPHVSLDEIVRQTRAAVAWLHRHGREHGLDTNRIHVGGSSAGAHLCGMLLAEGWHRPFGVPEDVVGSALLLSGIYDLEPLLLTHVNEWMKLDLHGARRNSPIAMIPPRSSADLLATVGGIESSEFKRQTEEYLAAWQARGHEGRAVAMQGYQHFDIALSLSEPDGTLAQALSASVAQR
ncbi:alpha/beta hydrolase [Methylobacterium dankookense]|uniref:Acetyl esterase n=1 Tax=Methylobacterium dankookense TaxID=560405 RepID=A0A564G7S1_9HYPH|nr:alpha/beta hydrolase [Methylobacterium dankookense]GJD59865.1 Acetyl esterase [Methylobacterium dankookense]VUF16102.1 Acetyl esterase [Methylobacterium dankookense]